MNGIDRFERLFIEITNSCPLQCSFCPGHTRRTQQMSPAQFQQILAQVRDRAQQVFLHVMGEPLLHPDLATLLQALSQVQLPCQITTSGLFLPEQVSLLAQASALKQINLSLQSLQELPSVALAPIWASVAQLQTMRPDVYINLRLWNLLENGVSSEFNNQLIDSIESHFGLTPIKRTVSIGGIRSKKIGPRLYLHFDSRFTWPDMNNPWQGDRGRCHGLDRQLAILACGTVVPCCLDRNGVINLGNIFTQSLDEILAGPVARSFRAGLKAGKLTQPLCQHCLYARRFSKSKRSHNKDEMV